MNSAELDQLDKLMAEVMGWKEGQPIPAPAHGCAPIDAEIVVPNTDDPFLVAWGTKVVGGTYPFWYGGVVYPGKGEPGFLWQPSRLLDQAMMVLEKFNVLSENFDHPRGSHKLWQEIGGNWVVGDSGDNGQGYWEIIIGSGETPQEAITLAVKAAWKGSDAENG